MRPRALWPCVPYVVPVGSRRQREWRESFCPCQRDQAQKTGIVKEKGACRRLKGWATGAIGLTVAWYLKDNVSEGEGREQGLLMAKG